MPVFHIPTSNLKKCVALASSGYTVASVFSVVVTTYLWYWACKKLNSSLILSQESGTVNLKGGWPDCVGPYKKHTVHVVSEGRDTLLFPSAPESKEQQNHLGTNNSGVGMIEAYRYGMATRDTHLSWKCTASVNVYTHVQILAHVNVHVGVQHRTTGIR